MRSTTYSFFIGVIVGGALVYFLL